MKIGLIGLGYWGKIILKTLKKFDQEIIICDSFLKNIDTYEGHKATNDYKEMPLCDKYFVVVPATLHYAICKFFLEKQPDIKSDVFCEKPLTTSEKTSNELYDLAYNNEHLLMTDWIFTFNPYVKQIKADYFNGILGKIRSINMNRLNFGPERTDVNAKWDLASHDISIIQYIFGNDTRYFNKPNGIFSWIDYKKNKNSYQTDSTLGFLQYDNFVATINASWYYRKKVRECIFEFDKCFVIWDDDKRKLEYIENNTIIKSYSFDDQPLDLAIKHFLYTYDVDDMMEQKELTNNTLEILNANKIQ